jgi:hypothetical protein
MPMQVERSHTSESGEPARSPEPSIDERPACERELPAAKPRELGGRDGPEPTRFGDWEKSGRCIDF